MMKTCCRSGFTFKIVMLVLLCDIQFVSSLVIKNKLENLERKAENRQVLEQAHERNDGEKVKAGKVYEAIRDQVLQGDEDEPTLLRQLPVRLLGYVNEVGESFKPLVGFWAYIFSYVVSITYVCADTAHQAWIVNESLNGKNAWMVVRAAIDAFIWQIFASVIVSGFVVNRVVALSELLLTYAPKRFSENKEKGWYKSFPTIMGMLSIPLIVKPIDAGVTMAMDYTIRMVL